MGNVLPTIEISCLGEPIPQGFYQVQWLEEPGGDWQFDSGWNHLGQATAQAVAILGGTTTEVRVVNSHTDIVVWQKRQHSTDVAPAST